MPNKNSEEVKDTQRDVKKYALIESLANSEAGKDLIMKLELTTSDAIDTIISTYRKASHGELLAACAVLAERITMLRMFFRAPKNRAGAAAELDRLLKDVDAENDNGG